jgi:hypothetical protein
MKKLLLSLAAFVLSLAVAGPSPGAVGAGTGDAPLPFPEIPRVTKEQVKAMLGNPDVIIVDGRPAEQWRFSAQKLPGAVHEDPTKVEVWAGKYSKDKTYIIY